MVLNITEKPEVAEKFIYFVFFKTKEKRFLVCHFKNTLETLFCTTEESEFVREEIQVTLKNYCWLFLWILAEESRNRRGHQSPIPESKCIIIGENEFSAAVKCAVFFSSSLLLSEVVNQNLAAAAISRITTAKVQSSAGSWNGWLKKPVFILTLMLPMKNWNNLGIMG